MAILYDMLVGYCKEKDRRDNDVAREGLTKTLPSALYDKRLLM